MSQKRGAGKKGQLTVFIILGILLLIAVGLVTYLQLRQAQTPDVPEILVPKDIKPVYDAIASCVEESATRAVQLVGLQGGFVEVPAEISTNPNAYLQVDDQGLFKIPLWYYEGKDRTPGIELIQTQISRYVLEHLRSCLQNFDEFVDYKIEEQGNITVKTILAEENVIVRLTWPLTITHADKVLSQEDYVASVPVRLRKIWQLASATMQFENANRWFENLTIDLYAADTHVPTDGMTVDCQQKKWNLQDIKQRMQQTLQYNLPSIRVENTDYIPFEATPETYAALQKFTLQDILAGKKPKHTPADAFEYNHMRMNVKVQPSDLKAVFEYSPAWGMLLNGQPNDGGRLESNLAFGSSFMKVLCINQWHFTYNMIYPVRMIIRDNKALSGRGFVFQMAFPVIIHENEGERVNFGLRKFIGFDTTTGFCDATADVTTDLRARGVEPGMLVGTELENANLTYECFDKTCDLGTTRADDGIYRLRTKLPLGCSNPFITAHKQGFAPARSQLRGTTLDLDMKRLQNLSIVVYKHAYHPDTQSFGPAEPLGVHDQLFIYLYRKADSRTPAFEQTIQIPQLSSIQNSDPSQSTVSSSIELLDESSTYELTALLTTKDPFAGKDALVGGYVNQNYHVAGSDLADKTSIELHVFEQRPIPSDDAGQQALATVLYRTTYQNQLKPVFLN